MTFTLLKYFEDRTQTDSFDSLSISATLNSNKHGFPILYKTLWNRVFCKKNVHRWMWNLTNKTNRLMTKALLFTLSKMIHTSGLPLNFRDVMPLDCRVEVCRGARPSADRGCITAAKGALASTLLNAKMRNGTPYGLVDLTDTRTPRTLTASAHEVFHLGQGQWTGPMNRFFQTTRSKEPIHQNESDFYHDCFILR